MGSALVVTALLLALVVALEPTGPAMQIELDVQPAALTSDQLTTLLDKFAADGITTVSTGANWASLQPRETEPPDWSLLDRLVRGADARGLKVRLRLQTAPPWVHPKSVIGLAPEDGQWFPPVGAAELLQWQHFVTSVVQRYGSRLEGVETWNEPNDVAFWKPSPDPVQFAALLRATWTAVKAVEPGLTVTSGGLSRNDVGFLRHVYSAMDAYPEASQEHHYFDLLGVHPYSGDRSPDERTRAALYHGDFGTMDENFSGMRRLIRVMAAAGDRGKHLWISEMGYSTGGTEHFGPVPDDRRALFLLRAFDRVEDMGVVEGMCWYHSHPTPWDPAGYDILGARNQESATYKALKQVTGRAPRRVLEPLDGHAGFVSGVLHETTAVFSPVTSMTRSELLLDGEVVASGSDEGLSWDSRSVKNGSHTLVLAAYSSDLITWHSAPVVVTVVN